MDVQKKALLFKSGAAVGDIHAVTVQSTSLSRTGRDYLQQITEYR